MTGILEFWDEFFHQVVQNSAETDDSPHIDVVVEWQDNFDQLRQHPKCLAFRVAIDQEVCYDIVKTLTVQQPGIPYGIGTQNIAELRMEV